MLVAINVPIIITSILLIAGCYLECVAARRPAESAAKRKLASERNSHEIEHDNNGTSRIHGGKVVKPGRAPFHVSLWTKNKNHRCGGVLLSPKHVLTAAACVFARGGERFDVHWVVPGPIREFNEKTAVTYSDRCTHSKYVPLPNTSVANVGILHLETPIPFNKNLHAIKLPTRMPQDEDKVWSVGLGQINDEGTFSKQLKIIKSEIIPCGDNEKHWSNICAFSGRTRGLCYGDFGAGMIAIQDGQVVLVGIHTHGGEACSRGGYYVSANIFDLQKEIRGMMKGCG